MRLNIQQSSWYDSLEWLCAGLTPVRNGSDTQ